MSNNKASVKISIKGLSLSGKTTVQAVIAAALARKGFNVECVDDNHTFKPKVNAPIDFVPDDRLIRIVTREGLKRKS